ncbi:MAG TPA: PASTA domain-containing protein, partial [Thermoanaerobaculia bacterium]|nr:PASTA domain-containing protein [Thermoanaerobaculia bacterium]
MATLPTLVRPGDVISAELFTAVLEQLAQLTGTGGGAGTQVVPNLFGAFLADARAIIIQPDRQLTMGFTFDVGGAAVDPTAAANASLIVLNQSPVADTRVPPSTPVNLVVSLSSVGPPPAG